jgi:hypothetical protein
MVVGTEICDFMRSLGSAFFIDGMVVGTGFLHSSVVTVDRTGSANEETGFGVAIDSWIDQRDSIPCLLPGLFGSSLLAWVESATHSSPIATGFASQIGENRACPSANHIHFELLSNSNVRTASTLAHFYCRHWHSFSYDGI